MQVRENIHNLRPLLIGVVATLLALGILSPRIQPAVVQAQGDGSFYGLLQKLASESSGENKVLLNIMLVPTDQKYSVIGYVKYVGDDFACFEYKSDASQDVGRMDCVVYDKIVGIEQRQGDLASALPQ